jgi:hypothetical protein
MQFMASGALAVAAATLLSGCGALGGDDQAAAPPPEPPAPSSSAPAQDGAPAAGNAEATAPGSKLKIGERAVVPYKLGAKTGTIGITVTAIEQGDKAAFAQRFGARAQGMDPYYIRYRVENVGGTDLSHSSAPTLSALGPGGGSTGAIVVGSMPGCERGRADSSFTTAGASYQGCRLQAARTGVQVSGVEYDDEGGYQDSPITWSR